MKVPIKDFIYPERYKILLCDIPWFYNSRCTWSKTKFGGGANGQYETMTTEKACKLSTYINNITDKDCFLFMWATFPNLLDALTVIEAWKFEYKTIGFLWAKTNPKADKFLKNISYTNEDLDYYINKINNDLMFFGVGTFTKSNTEPCLLAVKSNMKVKSIIKSNSVSSVIISPRENHSKKPNIVRSKIVTLLGDLPRLELFARKQENGWDAMGNELSGEDITVSLEKKVNALYRTNL